MLDRNPIAYERWDIASPELPSRSRLYQLEPIGVGTPMVESLTGYITRLAQAHCVSTGVLFSKEIDVLTGKGNIFTFRLEGNDGYSSHTINGHGVPAEDFVRALEVLTCCRGLSYLTLLPWRDVLPRQGGFVRRVRAWCAQCLRMWQADAKPIYEPLLWSLKPVTLCPIHRQSLCFVCPVCKLQNGVLDARTRPGHCSRCEQWLAPTANTLADGLARTNDDLRWGNWVATVLGELLAAAPRLHVAPTREGVAHVIRLCIERIAGGNASAFARELEVGRGDVGKWQTGRVLPKFPSLLALAYRLGVPLLDLIQGTGDPLRQKFVHLFPPQLSKKQSTPTKPRRKLRRMNRAAVLRILQAALTESPPPSVSQVTKRTDHDKPLIYRHFPKKCHAIARRFANHRKIRAVARRDRARVEIKEMAYQLHAKGIKITRKHLRPLLTSSDYTNLDEARAALRQVKEELQLD